jgi:hypothetical protein
MERSQILEAMGEPKLYGMRGAYDEIVATAVKRQHEPQRVVGDLLGAEISEKQARSIKYQMTIAKLPLAKDIDDFDFDAPITSPAAASRSCANLQAESQDSRRLPTNGRRGPENILRTRPKRYLEQT